MAGDRFGAFISYARVASSALALDLQNGMERFAKPWNKLRAVRIFRDDASMSANTALWSTIQRALERSEWFVLLATPQAAASEYVNDEVTWWVTHKGADKLLLVHAGGTVDWDDDAGDFSATSDAIPAALRGAYKEEPRWVDVTWYGEAGSLQRADPRFIERVADLSATVRGIEKDVLLGENVRQHRKTRRLTRAAIASLTFLLVIAVVTGGFAFVQRSEAVRQRDAATEQSLIARSRQLAATAVSRADTDLQSGLLLATTAYQTRPEYQTTQALHEVVSATPQLTGFYDFGEPLTAVDATPDAKVLVGGTESGKVYRFDRATGGRTELLDLGATVEFAAISDDGNKVTASSTTYTENGEPPTFRSAMWMNGKRVDLPDNQVLAMSPSGNTVVWLGQKASTYDADVLEITSNGTRATVPAPDASVSWAALPDDNVVMAVSYSGFIRASVDGSNVETTSNMMGNAMFGGDLSSDGSRFAYSMGDAEIEVWDFNGPRTAPYGDGPISGMTGNAGFSDIALNADGTRMATSADGSIFVSEVRPRGQSSGFTELRGAGANPHSLRFLTNEVVLSASGTSAALWDLAKTTPLATVMKTELTSDCRACRAPRVIVSPDANKIIVINNENSGVTVANMATGYSRSQYMPSEPPAEIDTVFEALPALVWLDRDHVFAYDTVTGNAWVLSGEKVDRVDKHMILPAVGKTTSTVLLDDGRVALAAEGKLVFVNPDTGEARIADAGADTLTSDAAYAIGFEIPSPSGRTPVQIVDTDSLKTVHSVEVDGTLLNFAEHTGDDLTLLREVRDGETVVDTEVLALSLNDGTVRAIGRLRGEIYPPETASTSDYLYDARGGQLVSYSLRDASQMNLVPVNYAPWAPVGVGIAADGTSVVVESPAAQTILRVPGTPEAWVTLACQKAGRSLIAQDLESIATKDGLVAGCGSALGG
jgi:WD40 repeat protein